MVIYYSADIFFLPCIFFLQDNHL